jgi:ATP-binding cassette subfamily C protein CydD
VAIVFGMRLLAGAMSFAPAYFVLLIAPEYFLTLRLLGTYYHSRMEAVSAADRVRALLESATPAAFAAEPCPPSRQPAAERATEVTLEDVCFAYGERPVLERVSVRIERGEHVTVMGASGSGKSTLLSLLLRFNDPQRGRILVDGAELSGRDPEQWRQRVAWLPQHPTLFHGTIRENIRLGRLSATDEQLRGAAERACVMEFAQRLPGGLDALVGERGQGLSVGQIQRVALARLFLRDPALVLLDEPTAHLDLESEQLVLQGIRDLAKGRTMILVTHRQAAVAPGNRLFLVEAGTLRGAG